MMSETQTLEFSRTVSASPAAAYHAFTNATALREWCCNDAQADVYPGAPELCDGLDNQCPGDSGHAQTDEGCPVCGNGVVDGDGRAVFAVGRKPS